MCDNAFAQTAVSKNARFLLAFSCVLVCVFVSECALLSMSASSCGYFDVFVLKVEFPSCAGLLGNRIIHTRTEGIKLSTVRHLVSREDITRFFDPKTNSC